MTERIPYTTPDYIKQLSRKLRKNDTEAEKFLWQYIKNKQIDGHRFLRQKPIFAYKEEGWRDRFFIADFYNHSNKLIIELDGEIHQKKKVKEYDKMREEILFWNSYTIIRFSNDEVLRDIAFVLKKIKIYLR